MGRQHLSAGQAEAAERVLGVEERREEARRDERAQPHRGDDAPRMAFIDRLLSTHPS